MTSTQPQPTLAQAFQAVFGGPLPRCCVHCGLPTTEVANHFTEGTGETGPYAWTEPAHEACTERMAAQADAYAQGWEDHLRLVATEYGLCGDCSEPLSAIEQAADAAVCGDCSHGPGCDGPLNCTCGAVA